MKKIQDYRFIIQILCLILTTTSFIINLKVTLIIILFLTIFSGVFYCGWVCPFGLIQDSFSSIGTALGIKKRKTPNSLHKILKLTRYILSAFVLLIGSDLIFKLLSFDPRANFLTIISGNVIISSAFVLILLFAILSIFFQRPFCNYFCIQGAKYGILSLLRPITIRRDANKCLNCKICDNICPMHIEVSKIDNLRDPQCINCFQCLSACPVNGVLSYGKIKTNKKEKKKYFIIFIAVVMFGSGYLGYSSLMNNKISSGENPVTIEEVYINHPEAGKGIPDGSYEGSAKGFKGTITVKVDLKDELLTGIEVLSHKDDKIWFNRAKKSVITNIIKNQSTDVDMVAGATYSSLGIKNSVINALGNAK
jgi:polyferredoxin